MYTTIGLSFTSLSISFSTSLIANLSPSARIARSRRARLERERVNRLHEVAQGLVDETVLVDEPETGECLRRDAGLEVVARPGRIDDLGPGPRDAGFDPAADLLGVHHRSVAIRRLDLEQARAPSASATGDV